MRYQTGQNSSSSGRIDSVIGNNMAEFDGESTSHSALAGLRAKHIELQPGMTVGLFHGNGRSDAKATLVNESRYIHFSCLLSGVSEAKVRGQVYSPTIGEGHIGFAPGECFSVQYSADYRHVELRVTPDALFNLVGERFDKIGDIGRGFVMRVSRPGNRTIDAATRLAQRIEGDGLKLLLHAAALEFLGWHISALDAGKHNDAIPLRERQRLIMAREQLLSDLSSPPTIAELARTTGLNQLKLKQGFKRLFGSSIYALFQQHRMEHARTLLQKHSVTDTALILGYSNISHFSSAFRKQFGILPSEARKSTLF